MFGRREKNAAIFKDTEYQYRTNPVLKEAIDSSIKEQVLILESDNLKDVVDKKSAWYNIEINKPENEEEVNT